jgi:1,4-alpha-glucan branching enzyme
MARKTQNYRHKKAQTFSITVPTAQSVQLVGDFTHWQERPVNLHKESDGVWRTTVKLEPGEHHYRFLVDGQWPDDPSAEQTSANPFGGIDAVLRVAI